MALCCGSPGMADQENGRGEKTEREREQEIDNKEKEGG